MGPREHLAALIDWMTCPECGAIGSPSAQAVNGMIGAYAVVPKFQCDTDGCSYNRHAGNHAWTLAFRD